MSGQSFRFLHSAGFRLHETLRGLTEVSDELLGRLIEAPFTSAASVFAAAMREEVDFVVLSGDLLDPTRAGPRAITFLQEQLAKLDKRGIAVYWSASQMDLAGEWIRSIEWPENLTLFSSENIEQRMHIRGDVPIAEILGRSWHGGRSLRAAEFKSESVEYFRLAVLPGHLDLKGDREGVRYWALGGRIAATPFEGSSVAHCPGTPQGLLHSDTGGHGCSLVNVDSDGSVHTRLIATDAVRWCHERVPISLAASRQEVRQSLRARIKHLSAEVGRPMLVRWTLVGESRFDTIFVQEDERQEMLQWLRSEYADTAPPIWSVGFDLQPPEHLPPEWCEEDSILGDYLRVVQQHELEPETVVDLTHLLPEDAPPELRKSISIQDQSQREELLRDAALMGADLLRGSE